jgi:hypothetical protein
MNVIIYVKNSLYSKVPQKSKLKVESSEMNYFGGFHSPDVRNKILKFARVLDIWFSICTKTIELLLNIFPSYVL